MYLDGPQTLLCQIYVVVQIVFIRLSTENLFAFKPNYIWNTILEFDGRSRRTDKILVHKAKNTARKHEFTDATNSRAMEYYELEEGCSPIFVPCLVNMRS